MASKTVICTGSSNRFHYHGVTLYASHSWQHTAPLRTVATSCESFQHTTSSKTTRIYSLKLAQDLQEWYYIALTISLNHTQCTMPGMLGRFCTSQALEDCIGLSGNASFQPVSACFSRQLSAGVGCQDLLSLSFLNSNSICSLWFPVVLSLEQFVDIPTQLK